ncbi:MAG TPA: hypothetical protein DEB09_05070 [Candidatus Magasanikbacteria bacterium]|nr:hypothetical protein [Candidatus Magasanikbacteria bacterium]
MLVIPAIDILNGKCVRLTQGNFSLAKKYSNNPVQMAKRFTQAGATRIHIVDLDGAKSGKPINFTLIKKTRQSTPAILEIGGGIRNLKTAKTYLDLGIDKIIIGTSVIKNLKLIKNLIDKYGSQRIIIGLDLNKDKIVINGWKKTSQQNYLSLAKKLKKIGTREIICTDISRDGMLSNPNLEPIKKLQALGFWVIISGGIANINTIKKLQTQKFYGAILGKALYENKINFKQAIKLTKTTNNLTKRIIPCLDVKNNQVVKGIKFKKLTFAGDPAELGKKYAEAGADELVFLDITATLEKRKTLCSMVQKIANNIFIPFTVGGGIKSVKDISAVLKAGADKIAINTAGVLNPKLIKQASKKFGSQCIVVAIDTKKVNNDYFVYINSGKTKTKLKVLDWVRQVEKLGAGEILLTAIDRDGTKSGFDNNLLRQICSTVNIPIIASGGAGKLADFKNAIIKGGADAVLAASIFHYNKKTINTLKKYLKKNNINVRI